ncbi:hypothetical protein [Nocardia sp. NPDC003979]
MAQTAEQIRRKVKKFNKVIIRLQKMGIALGPHHLITTTGRRTGQRRIAAIGVIPIAGQRYIFQAYLRLVIEMSVPTRHFMSVKTTPPTT